MIVIEKLTRNFGPIAAVTGIDLTVAKGEVLGFLGPNGAGKSTTMKMIAGYLTPTSGRVSICGHDVETDTIAAQSNLGYLPEGAPAYGDMTPRHFLAFIARVRGFRGKEAKQRAAEAAARTELEPVLDQPIETLSKGFKRRVGLAQSILHDPPVLVMDEPTDGLDPNQKHSVRTLIRAMAPEKAIIISTHLLEEVDAICTRAVIIDNGRIVADGTPATWSRVRVTTTPSRCRSRRVRLKRRSPCCAASPALPRLNRSRAAGDLVTLTAYPKNNELIIERVSQLVAIEHWDVRELYAEAGRLDDVFRAITTTDAQRARERAAA